MEEENKSQQTSDLDPTGKNDDVTSDDLDQGSGDNDQKAEEGNKENPEPKAEEAEAKSQKQSRATDAANAERRRKEKERDEARRLAREAEIRRQAVFEVKSGQVSTEELNELGLKKIEDEEQLFLVESLRKAKAEGVENPVAAAYQAMFGKQRTDRAEAQAKEAAEQQKQQKAKEIVAKDQADFKAKFGKTTAEVMKNEPEFMALFGDLIDTDKGNFTACYTAYTELKTKHREDAKREGSFPTNTGDGKSPDEAGETAEEFEKRFRSTYGHW